MASWAISMVDKKWQSKLQHTKRQVLERCLATFSRGLSFIKKQGMSRETTFAVEIPDDIVEEILHRIPAKYLVKWKPVSKGWKALIESDHLAEKHLRRRQKLYGAEEFKITFEGSSKRGFRIRFFSIYVRLRANNGELEVPRLPGSCNGLVCVFDLVDVHLINPTTGVIRTLVRLLGVTKLSAGFGRDGVTGRYKVVLLYRFGDNGRVETLVFDLSTSQWRWRYKTAGPMPLSFTLISPERNPVCVNGSVFWLVDHSEILVMDLHTEKFRTVSQPKDIDVSSDSIYMWSLKGRLCVSDLRQGLDSDVWNFVQDELGERWEKTRFAPGTVIPPLNLYSVWFLSTLVSPYQPSSSRESTSSAKYLSSS